MNGKWERCPRCDSSRTETISVWKTFFALLFGGSCLIWIGLIFPPLWIVAGLMIIASPFSFFGVTMNSCKDCNKMWRAGKAQEYKQAEIDIANAKKRGK